MEKKSFLLIKMLFFILLLLLLLCQLRIALLHNALARAYSSKIQDIVCTETSHERYVLEEPKLIISQMRNLSPKLLNAFHSMSQTQRAELFVKASSNIFMHTSKSNIFELLWRSCYSSGVESAKYFQDALLLMTEEDNKTIELLIESILEIKPIEVSCEKHEEFVSENAGKPELVEVTEEIKPSSQELLKEIDEPKAGKKIKKTRSLKNKHEVHE
jgi:hypothetical protein